MTTWSPEIPAGTDRLYLAIAAAIRNDVRSGQLEVGQRLPTHRELADALNVAVGTVTRAYAEAERQGLVRGEVGRGTYVSGGEPASGTSLPVVAEPPGFIDLSLNHPLYSQDPDLASVLREISRRGDLANLLHYQASEGSPRHRAAGAKWAAALGVETDPDSVVVCAGAQHAMSVSLAAVAEPGDLILTEELTYPGAKGVAEFLHLRLQGVAMDEHGLRPDAVLAACRQRKVRALYCTPTLQNPTCTILPTERRREIAEIAREHDIWIIEDDVHRRLIRNAPEAIAKMAPERTFFVAGTSKSLAGGLRVAFLVTPPAMTARVTQAVWSTLWMVAPLCAEIVTTWIEDGRAELVVESKRNEAEKRQELAREILGRANYRSHPGGLYLWLELPQTWSAQEFTAAARQRGVGVMSSEMFRVDDSPAPNAVRVCLGAPPERRQLKSALRTLAGLLAGQRGTSAGIV